MGVPSPVDVRFGEEARGHSILVHFVYYFMVNWLSCGGDTHGGGAKKRSVGSAPLRPSLQPLSPTLSPYPKPIT